MKVHLQHQLILLCFLTLLTFTKSASKRTQIDIDIALIREIHRRILHQPLFPSTSSPPPSPIVESTPPPSTSSNLPSSDQPFFPEVPATVGQSLPPPSPIQPANTDGQSGNQTATPPPKPTKKIAIVISVGVVTLGMLTALVVFLYRHKAKHHNETRKLVSGGDATGDRSLRFQEDSRAPPSSFLYIGTVEPNRRSVGESNAADSSPYQKLNSVKRSDRYRPSPELQPLPPLHKPPLSGDSPLDMSPSPSSSDDDSRHTAFYTPQGSTVSNEDGYSTPVTRSVNSNGHQSSNGSAPHSKRTSPKSRLVTAGSSSPETKHAIIPSIKKHRTPPRRPPSPQPEKESHHLATTGFAVVRPKFSQPPPPPNMLLLQSTNDLKSPKKTIITTPPPPPPPPPPPRPSPAISSGRKSAVSKSNGLTNSSNTLHKQSSWSTPRPKDNSEVKSSTPVIMSDNSSSEKVEGGESDEARPKLKALHWDKVRATSDRATVWDQLESRSSFQLNEDMMEHLFGCNSVNSVPKEPIRSVLPPVKKENRVLDPKKSQNIAILLRALNVTGDEVSIALLDGDQESLGADLLETLVKMAPTKEEEIKLKEYKGDISKIGSAERFLKTILDIPFAFKRVEAMLYRANFDTEIKYLRKSFQTLEDASEELKNSRLFLKLLEAVLRTGNRMNVGTNRGDAKAFKLETLLKLVDIKGTDGKTTLLHFVVQEIIRSEGASGNSTKESDLQNDPQLWRKDNGFRKKGLQVVSGLSRDLSNVKQAAGTDSEVLSSYLSKLETGLEKVRLVLQYEKQDKEHNFFESTRVFIKEAEEEIMKIKVEERKALSHVKEVTEYFHGDMTKEEAHPLRIFMIVRDFLSVLDHVCKEVGNMQDRTVVGGARSFCMVSTTSLPVSNRFSVKQDRNSDEESSSA